MSYDPGVIEKAVNAVVTQLNTHKVAGGKLSNVKTIMIGSREFETGGNDVLDLIMVNPVSFSSTPKTTASYMGENTAKMTIEFRLVSPKLVKDDKVSKAQNVLFDGSGNGPICFYQNFVYSLMFAHGGATAANFTPGLGLKLNIMPMPDYRIEDTKNFVEIVCNVNIEYIYTYSAIAGSTS